MTSAAAQARCVSTRGPKSRHLRRHGMGDADVARLQADSQTQQSRCAAAAKARVCRAQPQQQTAAPSSSLKRRRRSVCRATTTHHLLLLPRLPPCNEQHNAMSSTSRSHQPDMVSVSTHKHSIEVASHSCSKLSTPHVC